jgi:hypothetical protein
LPHAAKQLSFSCIISSHATETNKLIGARLYSRRQRSIHTHPNQHDHHAHAQSLIQAWYLTYGRFRGHTSFLASSILVGHVFPLGRRFCQNLMFLLKLTSVHLLSVFIFRALSVTLKHVSSGRYPENNGVFPSISICSSLAFSLARAFALLVSLRSSS